MPKTADAILNDDCWRMIISHFENDFRTLSRILRISQYFLAMTAPVLYGQLGQLKNKNMVKNWSINKCHRLSALLLTSSGFLDCAPTSSTAADLDHFDGNVIDNEYNAEDGCLEEFQTFRCRDNSDLQLPCYKAPLSIDYFGLLTRLPKYLMGEGVWNRLMESLDAKSLETKCYPHHSELSTARHATVLTKISIRNLPEVEKWLRHVEKFKRLETLMIDVDRKCSEVLKTRLFEFVNRHKAAVPGQLRAIKATNFCDGRLVMELNVLLKNPKSFEMLLYSGIFEDVLRYGGKDYHNNCNSVMDFISIKEFKFSYENNPTSWADVPPMALEILSGALPQCRQMEKLVIKGNYESYTKMANLLIWAPQELSEWKSATPTQSKISQEQSQLSRETDMPAPSALIPLKYFQGDNLSGSVLINVMDGFRYSLEEIDFSRANDLCIVSLDWNWSMPRLRVLRLLDCYIQHCKLEMFCPALEELYLEIAESPENYMYVMTDRSVQDHRKVNKHTFDQRLEIELAKRPWKAMPSLRVLHITRLANRTKLNLASIGKLTRLEELCLAKEEYLDEDDGGVFGRTEPVCLLDWDFKYLKRLTFLESKHLNWHRVLLRSAPQLEFLSIPLDAIVPISFWTETKFQTLKLVIEFEGQVNWNQADQERLRKCQDEKLEAEILLTSKYKAPDGQHIKNIHTTKIRTLEIGGNWDVQKLNEFMKIITQGTDRISLNDGTTNDSVDNNADLSTMNDNICFPHLRHLRLRLSPVTFRPPDFGDFIKQIMKRPNMVSVEVRSSVVSVQFLKTLKKVDHEIIPVGWENGFFEDTSLGSEGWCVLVVTEFGKQTQYYRHVSC